MAKRGKKPKHKGVACRRGQPIFYEELKKRRNFTLTDTAVRNLEHISNQTGISSLSETLEQILRYDLNPRDYLDSENEKNEPDQ